MKLFVEKYAPHGLKSGIIDMMGNVQKNFKQIRYYFPNYLAYMCWSMHHCNIFI